ncbi:DUF58 domain-containing protein [Massilia pseudoviolaceinigra]|uniref:DUF58 domain-containing protein n=1 Tax=Massilia pseudoviolaceinigra TaxID=3057165 RepID=UPI002796A054|nr:DUF58 domain-containing protein [Massilia sp. CCM 9206]MDQ1919427.1 DUF58 domain-containing protein [Massilia sp. CCM 9206]
MAASPNRFIPAAVRAKADTWLFQKRGVDPGETLLTQRRVFILPSGAGMGFAALILILLIGSINYSLGLGFALTFTMGTCAMVDIYMTYKNMAHLHLRPGRAQPVFAGEVAQFELHLVNRTKLDRYALWVDFMEAGEARHVVDVAAGATSAVVLSAPSTERGWLAAPRIRLSTRFPLGLLRAWSYWQPDLNALVYPFPEENGPPLPISGVESADGHGHAGHDDFAGIRSYQPGDPMRHMAWRQIARLDPADGGQLVTKHFEGGAVDELVLDFNALPSIMNLELRLSRMTRWVLDAEQRALPYAFRIGATDFEASIGEAHQAACLRALALHGLKEAP